MSSTTARGPVLSSCCHLCDHLGDNVSRHFVRGSRHLLAQLACGCDTVGQETADKLDRQIKPGLGFTGFVAVTHGIFEFLPPLAQARRRAVLLSKTPDNAWSRIRRTRFLGQRHSDESNNRNLMQVILVQDEQIMLSTKGLRDRQRFEYLPAAGIRAQEHVAELQRDSDYRICIPGSFPRLI